VLSFTLQPLHFSYLPGMAVMAKRKISAPARNRISAIRFQVVMKTANGIA
jgi:hypothetical protein